MTPKPVRNEPGSSPRMRADPLADIRTTVVAGAIDRAASAGWYARQVDRVYRAKCSQPLKKLRLSYTAITRHLTPAVIP